jgi:hypothetical protein
MTKESGTTHATTLPSGRALARAKQTLILGLSVCYVKSRPFLPRSRALWFAAVLITSTWQRHAGAVELQSVVAHDRHHGAIAWNTHGQAARRSRRSAECASTFEAIIAMRAPSSIVRCSSIGATRRRGTTSTTVRASKIGTCLVASSWAFPAPKLRSKLPARMRSFGQLRRGACPARNPLLVRPPLCGIPSGIRPARDLASRREAARGVARLGRRVKAQPRSFAEDVGVAVESRDPGGRRVFRETVEP